MNPFYKNRPFSVMLNVLMGLLILLVLWHIRPIWISIYHFLVEILAPFIIAMSISYVLNPIVSLLEARKVPRTVAVLLIYAVFIVSLTVILMNLIPMFLRQLNEFNEHIPGLAMKAQGVVDTMNSLQFVPDSIRMGINQSLAKLETGISLAISKYISGIGNTINMIFVAFIIPFLAFYMLKDFQLIEKTVLATVPKDKRQQVITLLVDIDTALGHYIRGQFLVCFIIGVLAYLGYWLVGMPYALLLASLVAVFNIIPYLGPFFGAAPAIVMASTISMKMTLMVALVNVVCQVLESSVISPQVVGRSLNMHPLLIIFALLAGGELAGVLGLILAVPFFAIMKVIVLHLYRYYVHRRTT